MAILGVVAAGCGGGPSAQEAPADTLVITLSDEPDNLNPIFGDLYGSIDGDHWPIFSSLLDHGEDVEPDLATELPEISADGRTVTVSLRDDVTWHDGACRSTSRGSGSTPSRTGWRRGRQP